MLNKDKFLGLISKALKVPKKKITLSVALLKNVSIFGTRY